MSPYSRCHTGFYGEKNFFFSFNVFNDELTLDNLCSRQLLSRIPAAAAEVTVTFTQTATFHRHWTASRM